eukprot:1153110-Pelagomonas_calceolata.AAC.2
MKPYKAKGLCPCQDGPPFYVQMLVMFLQGPPNFIRIFQFARGLRIFYSFIELFAKLESSYGKLLTNAYWRPTPCASG